MNMLTLIEKKKRGEALSEAEIRFFITGYIGGEIPDYQASALLMAVCFMGMDAAETQALTQAMAESGERADLSGIPGIKVDKHSTGGVADTTTLIAAPLAAACGVPVAKMSGRGLGHTGGTLDKLAAIPGMRTSFTVRELMRLVERVGIAVVGQTGDLAPADRMLYALRDVTATVDSPPLIASSIMSKKIAAGCQALALDVKFGSGAFNPTPERAYELARTMAELGRLSGVRTTALITDMNEPLGRRVGNGLEVAEALDVLSGRIAGGRLLSVALALAAEMLTLGGIAPTPEAARPLLMRALQEGRGMEKLLEMVAAQGGDAAALERPGTLWPVRRVEEVLAGRDGYVARIDARAVGRAAGLIGAGRFRKDDVIDPAVGVTMHCRLGDAVHRGDPLATLHINAEGHAAEAR
ncbi:MAG: thymidine phosphorylase, partial [Clostridiales bacterium]|nr:thymidine phosphorylase [Clostridiales bacterium]